MISYITSDSEKNIHCFYFVTPSSNSSYFVISIAMSSFLLFLIFNLTGVKDAACLSPSIAKSKVRVRVDTWKW